MADAVDSIRLVDQWTREDPIDEAALQKVRSSSVEDLVAGHLGSEDPPDVRSVVFTCDGCDRRYVCELIFDHYNTNGDCIYEK